MEYDVVVVGAGPGGLATAIRLKQLAAESGREVSVCVLEKGSEPGAHILSGAIIDPRALTELFPDWAERGAPLKQAVAKDEFLFLDQSGAKSTPAFFLPDCFNNHGNYIVSLGAVTRWLGQQAEALGVEIFPGFAADEILYSDTGAVKGVATGNMGIGKDGEPTAEFQLGMELLAKYTIFAEGARGHLGRRLIAKFKLDAGRDPQSYGIGIKELWQADPDKHQPGLVVHTAGWPLDANTYGGSFLYHAEDGKIAVPRPIAGGALGRRLLRQLRQRALAGDLLARLALAGGLQRLLRAARTRRRRLLAGVRAVLRRLLLGGLGGGLAGLGLHAGPARLRQAYGDRLLRGLRAVLALADVVDLLAHVLAGLRARRFSPALGLAGALGGLLLEHGASAARKRIVLDLGY